MRILCLGKNALYIHGKPHAYYAWANPLWACPREEIGILSVRKNAHNIRGEKQRTLCKGNAHGRNAHFMRGKKCA